MIFPKTGWHCTRGQKGLSSQPPDLPPNDGVITSSSKATIHHPDATSGNPKWWMTLDFQQNNKSRRPSFFPHPSHQR